MNATKSDPNSYVHQSAHGSTTFVGHDAIQSLAAIQLYHTIRLYLKCGLIPTRGCGPKQMLALAGRYTGKTYKNSRPELERAANDVEKWADTMRAALPVVDDRVHIDIFKAKDGRWTYCPTIVRHDPSMRNAFTFEGQFETQEQAIAAVQRNTTIPRHAVVHVDDAMGPDLPQGFHQVRR
jgi:hypothetical protein